MLSHDKFWSKWWTKLAEKTDGLPSRVRNSAFNDISFASKEIIDCLDLKKHFFIDKKNINILDIGAGSGLLTSHFINNFNTIFKIKNSATVIDLSPEYYKNKSYLFNPVCADAMALPFSAKSFDIIICYSSLQYFQKIENLQTAITEIYRVLAKSGLCLIFGFPEENKKKKFINGYNKTNLNSNEIEEKKLLAEKRLWLSRKKLNLMLKKANFLNIHDKNMNENIWEHRYMFNIFCNK